MGFPNFLGAVPVQLEELAIIFRHHDPVYCILMHQVFKHVYENFQ